MKMRAALLHDVETIKVVEIDKPVCGPADVLVKTVCSGFCGSDMTGYLKGGQYAGIAKDSEFGHEVVGYITEVGKEAKGFEPGMRVFIHPEGTMPPNHSMMLGGFSDFIRVPNAKLDRNLYLLPDGMTYDEGVLIEPVAVGTRGKNVAKAKPGDNVVVYGAGAVGLGCVTGLVMQGINPVAVVRNNNRKALLEKMGAVVCNVKETELLPFLKEHFGMVTGQWGHVNINVDIVVDCAGAPNILDEFLQMRKTGARLSLVGVGSELVPVRLASIMSCEGVLVGSRGYYHDDVVEVIGNLASKKTHMLEAITHRFPLEQIGLAFETMKDREKAIKIVIDME